MMTDTYAIMDYYANKWKSASEMRKLLPEFDYDNRKKAELIYKIILQIELIKKENSLRDFSEQVMHTIDFFNKHSDKIPEYEHILIDEYQDINDLQIELIDKLCSAKKSSNQLEIKNSLKTQPNEEAQSEKQNSKKITNIFAVGDPRQSIYGWRDAKIEHILGFNNKHPDASILQLKQNYRSTPEIIDLANEIIKPMHLPEIKSVKNNENNSVILIKHDSEDSENVFILHSILSQDIPRNQIFILSRTNKRLTSISELLSKNKIKFLKKSTDIDSVSRPPEEDEVVLSTVHAIKGLEAEIVFVVDSNNMNYPCKVSEHPVLELVKAIESYNKYDEELRLFYVALTRAKSRLVISYTGTITRFVPLKYVRANFPDHLKDKSLNSFIRKEESLYSALKAWRLEASRLFHLKAFQILTDSCMLAISQEKPQTIEELENISGIGPVKVNKYGDDILDIVKRF